LSAILFTTAHIGQLDVITAQIAKLSNISRRYKTRTNKVALEQFRNPLGISLVGFLALDSLNVLGVRQADITSWLKLVENRNPVFACGFHAHITAVVGGEPVCQFTQISCIGRKTTDLVRCVIAVIGGCDTCY